MIPGTAELIDEVEESKITGEEERYSKLDLPTFVANLDGAKAFYGTLVAAGRGQGAEAGRADPDGVRRAPTPR